MKQLEKSPICTHLVDFEPDEFVSKVAKTPEVACTLVETGLNFVCAFDDVKILRKCK